MALGKARLISVAASEGPELGTDDACALFAAMLAGEIAARELSAILAAWQGKRASLAAVTGFVQALDACTLRLERPTEGPRPVLLPAYCGTRRQPNLSALVALLLQRYETPVLVHGPDRADAATRDAANAAPDGAIASSVTTADVLWELGVERAANLADAQARLRHDGIAYVPSDVLAPGLAPLLASPSTIVQAIAMLIDPFAGHGYRVIGAASAADLVVLREFLQSSRTDALLFPGTEGEPFANPHSQTRLEDVAGGAVSVCAEAEADRIGRELSLPAASDAATTAAWITNVLAGTEPVPPSIIVQLGCCLAGARRPVARV